jgi:hypothetical protein
MKKQLCIVGGGPAGVGLAWSLAQEPSVADQWSVTILHDEDKVGGHCATYTVTNPVTQKQVPVDIGVQCVAPLINPNVSLMLGEKPFTASAPVVDAGPLKIACAFPPRNGQSMNWGNFPEYQQGPLFALYSEAGMVKDCTELQNFMRSFFDFHLESWAGKSVQDWLDAPVGGPLTNPADFVSYFVDPYMSVIMGYGAPDLPAILFEDILPLFGKMLLFPGPMAAWTEPGVGWQRWVNGARSWVQTMLDAAKKSIDVTLSTKASAVWLDPANPTGQVWVAWDAVPKGQPFDKVVLTTDMQTNATLLNNPNNASGWSKYYADVLSSDRWNVLQGGTCYIHGDTTILSPELLSLQQETVQFTAYHSTAGAKPGQPYNLDTTYASYFVENVRQDPAAKQLYVTMYGPKQPQDMLPKDSLVLVKEPFIHGLWLPGSMKKSTKVVYRAQGQGGLDGGRSWLPNTGTNLYFAGNNTTMDSVEGALVSAMAIANYAFGVPYSMPLRPLTATGFALFAYLYLGLMFPVGSDSLRHALTLKLSLSALGAKL